MKKKSIYLDNAATSFPKPESVYIAINKTMRECYGNAGRSGHKPSQLAKNIIDETRFVCKQLFNAETIENIIFTYNATLALNIAIKGLLTKGDHVITSSLEHNSVSRPLHNLETKRICEITKIHTDLIFGVCIDDIRKAVKPNTKLIICNHISNVTGTVNDVKTIGNFCRDNGLLFLVDAAQSAGSKDIDVQKMGIDLLAFPGHKGLFGPQGTAGLYIRSGLNLNTIIEGGTGNMSETLLQPEFMPHRFEAGTMNTPGLAGLLAGVKFILETGISEINEYETNLTNRLIKGLQKIEGVQLFVPSDQYVNRGNIASLIAESIPSENIMMMLDSVFNIYVRSGLHCSVDAHRTIGTLSEGGTLRISPNYFNTEIEIDDFLICFRECVDCSKM